MIRKQLDSFLAGANPGPFQYRFCHHSPGKGTHGRHLVLGCLTHGNEFGTLPALLRLQAALREGTLLHEGPVTLLLGNTQAALADKRFLEEDFNRVFTFDRAADSLERALAEQVRPILDSADVFLDLHQTQTPTARPFWTFPWEGDLGLWARALRGADVGLTRAAGQVFSAGTCCLDEYVRARGGVGLTLELGYRGLEPAQEELALRVMQRAIALVDALAVGASLAELAAASQAVEWYTTAEVVPARDSADRLRPGLGNWTAVAAGELLSPPDARALRASADGFILFPKYPDPGAPPPPELYRLARHVPDPSTLHGGSSEAAHK